MNRSYAFVLCFLALALPARGQLHVFDSAGLALGLDNNGRVASLIDLVTGVERIQTVAAYHLSLCEATSAGVRHTPTAMTRSGSLISYTFGGLTPAPRVDLAIVNRGDYLLIWIVGLADADALDEIRFVNLDTGGSIGGGAFRFLEYPDAGGPRMIGLCGLDVFTRTQVGPGAAGSYLWATAYRDLPWVTPVSMVGRGAALFACAADDASVLSVVARIEQDASIPLGVAARQQSVLNRSGVFWVQVPYQHRQQVLQYTLDAGAGKLLMLAWAWANPRTRYLPPTAWGGWTALNDWVEQCRTAGLVVGAHFYPSIIPNDAVDYIRGGCHPNIRRDHRATLAVDLPASQTDGLIQTVEPPTGWPLAPKNQIVIGQEIIGYTGISVTPPYGLTGPFTRAFRQTGPGGLGAQSHAAGAAVEHLAGVDEGGYYQWDLASGGVLHWMQDITTALDAIGFDYIYIDNLEDCEQPEWFTHGMLTYLSYLMPARKPLWLEASDTSGSFSWPLVAMSGQMDYWYPRGFRVEVERNLARFSRPESRYDVKQLGWPRPSHSAAEHVTPDEFEYLVSRGLAFDAPVVIEVWWDWMQLWPNRDANLYLMKTYENLRLSQYFQDAALQPARTPYQDVMLFRDGQGHYRLTKVQHAPVADNTPALRAFVSSVPIDGEWLVSVWAPALNDPRDLFLIGAQASDITAEDYRGNPLPLTNFAGSVHVPIQSRSYLRLRNVSDPFALLRNARLTASTTPCAGDTNHDRRVNESDMGVVLASIGVDGRGDLDGDNDTDEADLGIVLANWGLSCP